MRRQLSHEGRSLVQRTLRLLQVKQFKDRRGLVVLRESAMTYDGETMSATSRGFLSMSKESAGKKVTVGGVHGHPAPDIAL